jgi:hypothetical protein
MQRTERSWVTIVLRAPAKRSWKNAEARWRFTVHILNFFSSGQLAGGKRGSPSHPLEGGGALGGLLAAGRLGLGDEEGEGDRGGVV